MAVGKDSIVRAGLEVLSHVGLADLSMRRIANVLGVKASALYWHFPNKQALLAAMADAVVASQPALGPGGWGEVTRTWMEGLRATLLAQRDGAALVSAGMGSGLMTARPSSPVVPVLVQAGWTPLDARYSSAAMTRFVLGHVAEEQARQQLIREGVLPSGAEALDEAGFSHGVKLLLAGTANVSVG
jgi:AcrR family transcriptional regulator